MGIFGAAIGKAVGSTIKNAVRKSSGSKSGSGSSGSRGSSSSNGWSGSNSYFKQYNPNTDYSQVFNDALYSGASGGVLQGIYDQWNSKVQNPAYSKWDTPEQRSYMEGMINASGGMQNQERDYYQDYQSEMEGALREQYEQQQRAMQEGINSAVSQNESYIPQVNKSYEDAVRSAYVSREQAKVQAPEAMSAMGMTGGASESALLGINAGFENARSTSQTSRDQALQGIAQNSANIRSTGDTNLASLGADYSGKLAQALQSAQQMAMERANFQKQFDFSNKQFNAGNKQWQQQFDTGNKQWQQQFDREGDWGNRDYALQKQQTSYSTGKPYYNPSSSSSKVGSKGNPNSGYKPLDQGAVDGMIETTLNRGTNTGNDVKKYSEMYTNGQISLENYKSLLKKYGYGTDGKDVWITD